MPVLLCNADSGISSLFMMVSTVSTPQGNLYVIFICRGPLSPPSLSCNAKSDGEAASFKNTQILQCSKLRLYAMSNLGNDVLA